MIANSYFVDVLAPLLIWGCLIALGVTTVLAAFGEGWFWSEEDAVELDVHPPAEVKDAPQVEDEPTRCQVRPGYLSMRDVDIAEWEAA